MKQFRRELPLLLLVWLSGLGAHAQNDMAINDVFRRSKTSVYTVNIEIPREIIQDRYNNAMKNLRNTYPQKADGIPEVTREIPSFNFFEHLLSQYERELSTFASQLMKNNRVLCSGFAVDPQHLVTISSIVQSATFGGDITISDDYKQEFKAKLVNTDKWTGVAVLRRLEGQFPGPYIELDPTQWPVGSFVISIQRAYSLPAAPVPGIIQGYDRTLGLFKIERYIQSNIDFYPGNEGAPVLGFNGRLVGMMATEYRIGDWPGVTFIVPSDIIVESALDIIQNGRRIRGWIPGVLEIGDDARLRGLVINDVDPAGPTAKNFRKGDIITAFDGVRANEGNNIYYKILNTKPNVMVTVEVLRDNLPLRFDVLTTELKE